MTDPIDRLVAEIDKLIDEELARGPRDGEVGQAICALCGGDWHGAPADADTAGEHRRTANCPGSVRDRRATRTLAAPAPPP